MNYADARYVRYATTTISMGIECIAGQHLHKLHPDDARFRLG